MDTSSIPPPAAEPVVVPAVSRLPLSYPMISQIRPSVTDAEVPTPHRPMSSGSIPALQTSARPLSTTPRPEPSGTSSDAFAPSRGDFRPSMSRRGRSDPRHNRTRRPIQSYGSPLRRPRQRAQQSSQPLTEDSHRATLRRLNSAPTDARTSASQNRSNTLFDSTAAAPPVPALPRLPKTAQQVHEELQRRVLKDITPNPRLGRVYIIQDPARPHLLKIGATMNSSQRLQQIERQCGVRVERVYVSEEIENYTRAEHLAQGDLWHLCRPYWCSGCVTEHREWHEVDKDLAVKTVQRWVKFLRNQPYDATGRLKEIWRRLLVKRRRIPRADTALDHDTRWEHWCITLLPPTFSEHCEHWIDFIRGHPIWSFLWNFSWQVSAVSAWMVTFSVLRNLYSFIILSIYLACCWISMSGHLRETITLKGAKGR